MSRFGASSMAAKIMKDNSVGGVIIQEQVKTYTKMTGHEQDAAHELLISALIVYGAGLGIHECADVLYELTKLV